MSARRLDVVGFGYSVWDTIVLVPRVPDWDDPQPESAVDLTSDGGGPVATALVTLARLGAQVGYVGMVGDDSAGTCIRRAFSTEGVDLERLRIEEGAESRQTTVLVQEQTGKRSFLSYQGSLGEPILSEEDRRYMTAARFLHLDGLHMPAAITAARWLREVGGEVVYDANRPKPGLSDLMPHIGVLISNASFPAAYTGEANLASAARTLLAQGPRLVVVTLSDRGCVCFSADEEVSAPGFAVPVVDTTGAGDAFHGAFIFALLRGWNTQQSATFANAVAAINCTALGGRAALPSLAGVLEFLSARGQRLEGEP